MSELLLETSVGDATYSYRYPGNKNGWKPDGKLHKKVLSYVMERVQVCEDVKKRRNSNFRSIEDNLTGFIQLSAEDEKHLEADELNPTRLVVPESLAALESIMTYHTALFSTGMLVELDPNGPEDKLGALLLEQDLHIQNNYPGFQNFEALKAQWRSSFVYGYGIITPQWTRKWEWKRKTESNYSLFDSSETFTTMRVKEVCFEGNKLLAISPYLYIHDPNVPIHLPNEGEFCGFIQRTNLPALLQEEDDPYSGLFNVRYLQHRNAHLTSKYYEDADNTKITKGSYSWNQTSTAEGAKNVANPVDLIYLYAAINPKRLGVGSYDGIEKWLFVVAGDHMIIYAEPLDLDHDNFPVSVCAPDTDGFTHTPLSRMELVNPIQNFLNWMFAAIIAGKRESMRARPAYDPSVWNEKDINNPNPNAPIRMRRSSWGRSVKDTIMFVSSPDVTGELLNQTAIVSQMLQKATGATDVVQGLRRQTSERVSALEAAETKQSAVSRLQMLAQTISNQSLKPLGYMMAKQTQQFREREGYQKTSGRLREYLINEFGAAQEHVFVTPEDLYVDYDVMIRDPSMPQAQFLQTWQFIFQTVSTNPQLMAAYDVNRIFMHLARVAGATDVQDFLLQQPVPAPVEVRPDQEVQNGLQQANVTPFSGVGKTGTTG